MSEQDFMCRCSDESSQEAESVLQWAYDHLKETGYEEPISEHLLTGVIYELNWEHEAYITQIACDQWAGVWASKHDKSFDTYVQCDRLEDGIARTLQLFAEHDKQNEEQKDEW